MRLYFDDTFFKKSGSYLSKRVRKNCIMTLSLCVHGTSLLNRVLGVLACSSALRVYVVACSRVLRASALTCLRAYMLRVLACLRASVLGVLACFACLRA